MTQPVSSVTAVLPKDTVYTVNDSDVKVVDGRPSLLVDEIVSTDNSASGSDYRGVLVGMYYQTVDITMGASIGMKTFASAILGGVGVLPGAMVGGLVVGVIETFAAGYISSGYRDAISFVVLILVLLIKPSGLFGSKQINKV